MDSAAPSSGPEEDPDAPWADRARRGDRDAAAVLVERHHARVARLLWSFARNRSDLDDLVQDTFLKMVRSLPSWKGKQPFRHWLLRIATNTGRDYFRRQAVRRRWQAEPSGPDEPVPEPPDPGSDPAARAAANEVKTVLAKLPPEDRTLLTLFHLEGWELSQIAEQFGWPTATAKVRAWRARRRLRHLLESSESP